MLTNFEYMIIWVIYSVAAVVSLFVVWKITNFLPRQLNSLLRAIAVVILFTPWFVDEGQGLMAPAVVVFAFDNLVKEQVQPLRALMPLVIASFVACLCLIVYRLVMNLFKKDSVLSKQK